MIDYSESDNKIEICGKLDKSNRFRGAIFRSFISFLRTFSNRTVF